MIVALYSYIIFADKRFRGRAKAESKEIFSAYKLEDEPRLDSERFFVVRSEMSPEDVARKARDKDTAFIEKIANLITDTQRDQDSVVKALVKSLDKNAPLRLEVLNANSSPSENAKSTEVKIGRALESLGFTVDLKKPKTVAYVIFLKDTVLIGMPVTSAGKMDSFRHYGKNTGRREISRAEFKLQEAIEAFGIDMTRVKHALDIGASPGGWTGQLLKFGAKVVAVDTAPLAYRELGADRILISMDDTNPSYEKLSGAGTGLHIVHGLGDMSGNYDIIHIARPAEMAHAQVEALAKTNRFDMLLLDVNESPDKSAVIANKFSDTLNKDAYLILTVKLVDMDVDKHVKEVKRVLGQEFGSFRIKKLPHNRRELTLFAIKT